MDSFRKSAEWILHNKKVIGYFLIAVFFAVLAQQLYNRYINNNNNNNSQLEGYSNASSDSGADNHSVAVIRMFKVDWCPHCKTAKPEWEKVRDKYQGQQVNGHVVTFTEMNCTNETTEIAQMIEKYKIEGYPTIKLVKDDQVIDFEAKPTESTLTQFLNTAI